MRERETERERGGEVWRIFHTYEDVIITGEELQILNILDTHGHWAVRVL